MPLNKETKYYCGIENIFTIADLKENFSGSMSIHILFIKFILYLQMNK